MTPPDPLLTALLASLRERLAILARPLTFGERIVEIEKVSAGHVRIRLVRSDDAGSATGWAVVRGQDVTGDPEVLRLLPAITARSTAQRNAFTELREQIEALERRIPPPAGD
jgi:hypothetical protein